MPAATLPTAPSLPTTLPTTVPPTAPSPPQIYPSSTTAAYPGIATQQFSYSSPLPSVRPTVTVSLVLFFLFLKIEELLLILLIQSRIWDFPYTHGILLFHCAIDLRSCSCRWCAILSVGSQSNFPKVCCKWQNR